MAEPKDHPALERLLRLDRHRAEPPRMGYQPSLDGVRALSVLAVILYHAGFPFMHGGFFGVEVFFVVSGFLITSLLIEERDRSGRVDLRKFWVRRFRRLLPALATVLVAVGVWAVFWGSSEQHTQMRHDYPWAIFYFANWGQIFSEIPYFTGTPTLLRHLWSLAVEEQWYALWPLAFILIHRRGGSDSRRGFALTVVSVSVMALTALGALSGRPSHLFNPFRLQSQAIDTTNFLYLSTITRSSGLLLGAAMAFVWRPWRIQERRRRAAADWLDVVAVVAVLVLVASFFVGRVEQRSTYLVLLPLVTLASAALVGVLVHPGAGAGRSLFGWQPLVEIGKRSYGLYLWSWPISRICGAYEGSPLRFALAMAITVPLNELCYRFVETPIRSGGLGQFWVSRQRRDWNLITTCATLSVLTPTLALGLFFVKADPVYDAARDDSSEVFFDAQQALGAPTTLATGAGGGAAPSADSSTTTSVVASTTSTTPTTLPTLPRKLVIVGDSTAHSLAVNLPDGIEGTFTIADGSVEGCSVYSAGVAVSSIGFTRGFSSCAGWEQRWVKAAQSIGAEVALVSLGAWDVFDVKLDSQMQLFASPAVDQRLVAGLQQGIDALAAVGVKVALLEVPCMRPKDVEGAGVPALPERGMDDRVAHVNDLLRQVAAANPATATFVTGPAQYCTDPTIASSLAYRWDGVHAYKPGAKLTFETVAAALLAIPVP